jgi:hypothetical protein
MDRFEDFVDMEGWRKYKIKNGCKFTALHEHPSLLIP